MGWGGGVRCLKEFTLATDQWAGRMRSGTSSGSDAESIRKKSCAFGLVVGNILKSPRTSKKQRYLVVGVPDG